MNRVASALALCLSGLPYAAGAQPSSVVNSPHNLSAGGPGPIRAVNEDEVCIFCHTPHNASPVRPLWNRSMPTEGYTIYGSRSLDAKPGQPTGNSKMCLSCHDGTIALGSVFSRGTPIQMAGGITTMPAGASNIGTDLADDHPISFRYDSGLAAHDTKLRDPASLPRALRLDANAELQCTTCHDAHDDSRGKFLVMHNTNSQLCTSCHQMGTTTVAAHTECIACHQAHTAPSGPYLLRARTVGGTCLTCHNGSRHDALNVAQDITKVSTHDIPDPSGAHPQASTACTDCHEPHTMARGSGLAGGAAGGGAAIPAAFGRIGGVNASGSAIKTASYEHEVCFTCHGETSKRPSRSVITRQIPRSNTRLEFSPGSVSYHPVGAPGRNPDVPSLKPGWTTASTMSCSSCHGSDTGRPVAGASTGGGSGPSGVHGSNFAPILRARYDTADFTTESAHAYALCYSCHERGDILSDRSFKGHRKHIVDLRTPCAACHTAHGIPSGQGSASANSNLINFSTSIVRPDRATGRLEFRDSGVFSGACFLSCHGENHSPKRYP
jgi:predicted CXXCH cytochrome family protein